MHYCDNSHRWIAPPEIEQRAWSAQVRAHMQEHLRTMGGPAPAGNGGCVPPRHLYPAHVGRGRGHHVRRDRQQRLVAPDVPRAGLEVASGDPREVVADLERPEALATGVERAELLGRAALTTDQRGGVAERTRSQGGFDHWCAQGVLLLIFPGRDLHAGTDLAPSSQRVGGDLLWRVAGASAGRVPLPLSMSKAKTRRAVSPVVHGSRHLRPPPAPERAGSAHAAVAKMSATIASNPYSKHFGWRAAHEIE